MPKIKVDEMEYNSEDLSDHGLATLKSLQFLEGQLQKLKSEIAISQTARQAYMAALKSEIKESGITHISNKKEFNEED
tara:strand:- start:502 stop:735 length:234 start_codon:yes stop_codon:yes gene_type:complete